MGTSLPLRASAMPLTPTIFDLDLHAIDHFLAQTGGHPHNFIGGTQLADKSLHKHKKKKGKKKKHKRKGKKHGTNSPMGLGLDYSGGGLFADGSANSVFLADSWVGIGDNNDGGANDIVGGDDDVETGGDADQTGDDEPVGGTDNNVETGGGPDQIGDDESVGDTGVETGGDTGQLGDDQPVDDGANSGGPDISCEQFDAESGTFFENPLGCGETQNGDWTDTGDDGPPLNLLRLNGPLDNDSPPSFDAPINARVIPEPASLLLFGAALCGWRATSRRARGQHAA